MKALSFTHFFMGRDAAQLFTLDHCENCGGEIQAANAVGAEATREKLLSIGLIEVRVLPVEGYYSEECGGEACYNCNG